MKRTLLILLALGTVIMVGSVIATIFFDPVPEFDGGYR